jgi:hypothetical protein
VPPALGKVMAPAARGPRQYLYEGKAMQTIVKVDEQIIVDFISDAKYRMAYVNRKCFYKTEFIPRIVCGN